jgi:hypothetical protein
MPRPDARRPSGYHSDLPSRRNRSTHGGALLYVIAAIVLLGAIGGGVAYFSSSSSTSQLTQTRAEQAYSAALSGMNYASTLDDAGFLAILAATGSKQSFTLDDAAFTLVVSAKTGACYPTSSIGVAASGTSLEAQYSANDCVPPKTTGGEEPEDPEEPVNTSIPKGTAAQGTINFSGEGYDGNYYFQKATFNWATINGSLYHAGVGSDCLTLSGPRIGKEDGTSVICSNTCIIIQNTDHVYGTVVSQGNITINRGVVHGNVSSGGNLTIARWNGKVVKIDGNGGNVYYYGTISPSNPADIAAIVEGSAVKITDKPDGCPSYTLPEHKVVTPTSPDPNYGGQFTFVGKDINNTTTYAYPSFTTGGGAKTCFDLSDKDTYVNIFVQGDLKFGSSIYITTDKNENCFQDKNKPSTSNYTNEKFIEAAKRIYIDVRGSSKFSGDGHAWIGTLFSKGDIKTEGSFVSVGALYSNGSINTSGGSYSYFVASDYANKYWP